MYSPSQFVYLYSAFFSSQCMSFWQLVSMSPRNSKIIFTDIHLFNLCAAASGKSLCDCSCSVAHVIQSLVTYFLVSGEEEVVECHLDLCTCGYGSTWWINLLAESLMCCSSEKESIMWSGQVLVLGSFFPSCDDCCFSYSALISQHWEDPPPQGPGPNGYIQVWLWRNQYCLAHFEIVTPPP